MKSFIFLALFLVASTTAESEEIKIEEAQMPMFPGMMGPMGMGGMGMGGMGMMGPMGMPGMMGPMGGMGAQQSYPIDYSQSCSNSCGCARVCVPWTPCQCRCPPPCPDVTTTTVATPPPNRCIERGRPNAPDNTFPYCCENGQRNFFCCDNGAENPECSLTQPPTIAPETTTPSQPCNPCQPCMPCMIWWMCPPCNCNNGCSTQPPTTVAPTPPPNRCIERGRPNAPDFTFPYCCDNGQRNFFCCTNGSEEPDCSLTQPPTIGPDTTTPSQPCNPCQPCMPCMIWWMCSPCNNNCNNGCQTEATTVATPPTAPVINNTCPCVCAPCQPWQTVCNPCPHICPCDDFWG